MPHRRSRSSFIRAVLIGRLPGFFAPGVVILMLTLGCIGSPMADAAPVTASEAAALTYDELRAEAGDEFEARVEEGLRRAGGNRTAVESFLATARESGDARRLIAAEFLVANMPTVDLVSMSSEHLKENLDLAFSAWDTLPWAQDVPMNLFLHYVLPHRVTQEPFEPWRAEIYTELASALAKCDNMVDAAVAVNYWCGARVGFKQTEFRDQNINSTIKAGYGRCEEMMIVAIAAMRAMGIPARACSAPWWVTTDNNHAWVEVWADGHWYYTGGCEPRASLDNAWFNGAAQRAGIVVSRMFGDPTMFPTGEVVAIAGRDSAVVNSTAVYARTGEVELVVTDASGEPVADCPVAINAFNFGAFRSLLTGRTDEDGRATFVVGLGDYFYTVGNQRHGRGHAVISTVPGERTTHEFTLQDGAAPPDLVVLNYPTPAEAAEQAALRDKSSGQPKAEYRPELPPNPGIDRFEAGQWTAVDELLDDMAPNDADLWRGIFNDALGNWRAIAEGLLMLPEAHHDDALALMQQTTRLDRLEITPETIVDHIAGVATLSARETVPAERFRRYVLNPRVDIEHITGWRGKVGAFARSNFTADSTEATVEALNRWTAESLASVGRSALGPTMNPGQVLISGHAEDRERAIVAVGALRSLGIPARKEATRNLVEYHDGEQWHSFDPKRAPAEDALAADSASPAGPEGTATEEDDDAGGDGDTSTASIQSGPGVISLSLSRSGQPVAGNFNGFDVSRFGGGRWNSIRGYNSNFDGWTRRITLPAGEYLVTAGVRNSNGDPAVRTQVVRLAGGDEVSLEWDLQSPTRSGAFELPIARTIENPLEIAVPGNAFWRDAPITLGEIASGDPDTPLVLFLFTLDNEPSKRLYGLLRDAADEIQDDYGARILALRLPDGSTTSTDAFAGSNSDRRFAVIDVAADVADSFALPRAEDDAERFASMPAAIVLTPEGEVRLFVEGYHLNLVQMVKAALTASEEQAEVGAADGDETVDGGAAASAG